MWVLTLSLEGQRVTETIAEEQIPEIEALLQGGRVLREALVELATINGKLFRLQRKQRRTEAKKRPRSKRKITRRPKKKP